MKATETAQRKACPKCGELSFSGRGWRVVQVRQFSRNVYDEKPRGPKMIDSNMRSSYFVCRSCGHDWEEVSQ